MRKTFKFICAAVVAAFAVSSCYDDSKLWTELEELDQRVTSLETALNADVANLATLDASHKALDKAVKDLEAALKAAAEAGDKTNSDAIKALQAEVAALQAQLAGVKVENKNGAVVVTIGKDSFTLSQNGVLTIVEEDGVKYWALVDPATGKVTNLEVKVGHDLKFKVDPKTAEVLVSYDGVEYVGTGVYAAEDSATLIGEVEETDDAVTITIGDATYTLAKWSDDKSVLGLSRADFFLMYGATKVVELTATDIAEYYVMAKPDGWKASFEGKTLTVVAPAKKTYELGAAEAEGEILVHATTVEGKCKVAKIDVKTGDGITMSIDKDGKMTIKNAYVGTSGSEETGYTYGFQNFAVGIVPASEFFKEEAIYAYEEMFGTTDPYVGFEKGFGFQMPGEPLFGIVGNYYNNVVPGEYKEGVYEVDVINTDINTVYSEVLFSPYTDWEAEEPSFDLPYGPYIVWVASLDENGVVGGMRFAEYLNVKVDVELVSTSYNDIKVKVSVAGADEYMIGYVSASEFNMGGHGPGPLSANTVDFSDFDEYMLASRGPWKMFAENGVTYYLSPQFGQQMPAEYIPMYFPAEGTSLVSLGQGEYLSFNEDYYFWVMPMFSHMTKIDMMREQYDFSAYNYEENFKPYVSVFTTADIQANGTCQPEITFDNVSYTTLSASVAVENADLVYYALFSYDAYSNLSNDQETLDAVISACESPASGAFEREFMNDFDYTPLTAGAKYYLAVVAIDSDGKYTLVVEDCTTSSYPSTVNDSYAVSFGNITNDYTSVKVSVTPSTVGTTYYYFYTKAAFENMEASDVMIEVLTEGTQIAAASDVAKSSASPATDYVLAVVVLGEDGQDYKLITKDCSTKSYPYDETNIKLSLKSLTSSEKNIYTAVFSVEGASDIIYQVSSAGYAANFPLNVVKYAPTQNTNNGSYEYATVSNNEVTITFESSTSFFDYSSDIYVTAYNVTDGSVSSMSKVLTFDVADKYEELKNASVN